MTRDEYAREYSGGYARTGAPVIVPDDVVRVAEHEPCFMCGVRAGCRHRRWAA